jgi:hypothetical protein
MLSLFVDWIRYRHIFEILNDWAYHVLVMWLLLKFVQIQLTAF